MQECRDESEIYIYLRIQLLNNKEECVYLSANRFSMAWEKGIQVPYPFFVFAWHWKTDLNFAVCFRFRLTLKNDFELRIPFFVFASLWKTDINISFRFSFSHHFEKRIWISFFGFALLWKTDLNFVSRFLSLWKTDLNFVCRFGMTWETDHCTSSVIWSPGHPLGVYRGIHFLCNWK